MTPIVERITIYASDREVGRANMELASEVRDDSEAVCEVWDCHANATTYVADGSVNIIHVCDDHAGPKPVYAEQIALSL